MPEETQPEQPEPATVPEQQQQQNGDVELGEAGKRAIAAERKAAKDAKRQADEYAAKLKQYEDRDKTELQRLAERAENAERELTDTRSRALRSEVAAAKGLPPRFASRLVGATREELEADADDLLTEVAAASTQTRIPSFDAGVRAASPTGATDMNAALRRATGRG